MSESITLYSHKGGPNPWKVVIVLEELGLKYNTVFMDMNTGMFLSQLAYGAE